MKLFLIRHAESEHNVAQVYAGVTDSALSNHGMLQIDRLAHHFAAHAQKNLVFTRVFCSDLARARLTAEGICAEQTAGALQPVIFPVLREKDFGYLEGKRWDTVETLGHTTMEQQQQQPESQASITLRVTTFVREHILPLLLQSQGGGPEEEIIAVVSHGITLRALWDVLEHLFHPQNVHLGHGIAAGTRIPSWSNTGYLELDIHPPTSPPAAAAGETVRPLEATVTGVSGLTILSHHALTIRTVNGRTHLSNLRRTPRVGSATHDAKQKRIDGFFKKKPL
ncbi:hypothetical protein AJ80_05807 [Polytolypa hystricis UAMH7299]|uniref:Phosphoglycerate mutase n=1 Tax=Polytolypa hystricis (strain UAMH7299) TaxID=1447883 RepID=A0A2B7Y149_POLH7|nr:hypothetical protein AJ80_05807 [Polytolypa hystricis UAMH7299]